MKAELLWFAYLAVEKNMVTEGRCREVAALLDDSSTMQDLTEALDQMGVGAAELQRTMREAVRRGSEGELPPANYLRGAAAGFSQKTLIADRDQVSPQPPRRRRPGR